MLDNGIGIYGMSHVSMNIIQQSHDEPCAIYQVVYVYAIYQSIKLSMSGCNTQNINVNSQ